MNIALVAIGRLENQYAVEFVEHYQQLGFDRIIIIDNNHSGEEHFEEVLSPFISSGLVTIEDYRDQVKCQMRAYNEVYSKYKNDYDWIAFLDFDEFLFVFVDNVKEWLSSFPDDAQAVLVNWMTMTDNNLITYDPRPLKERFTEPMDNDKQVQYPFPENRHCKSIIRGGLSNMQFLGNPHVPTSPLVTYNALGKRVPPSPFQDIDHSRAYIKHYTTKTLEEFITGKLKKGTPDRDYQTFINTYSNRFFRVNQLTDDKLIYLKRLKGIF